jgi:uncharacterized membrane protein YkvA (DUF1232 family)
MLGSSSTDAPPRVLRESRSVGAARAGTIDEPAGARHPRAVVRSITSLPRYLFTGRFLQVLLHLPNFVRLYWRLFCDRRVPILPKALLVLTLLYVFSPVDVIPDFIPLIGEMDDVVVVLSGLWLFVRLCPPDVVRETVHDIAARAKARG